MRRSRPGTITPVTTSSTAPATSDTEPTWADVLTYPISPEYVKGWDSVRAAAELIANALDEDEAPTVTWSDGVLVIEDGAEHGVGEEGMVLGLSTKGSDAIGQFGEGLKIACLVLARDPQIGAVDVDTVGYRIRPAIERRSLLGGHVPRKSAGPAPEVLTFHLSASTRTRGTRITVECPKRVADAARARFLQLTLPGYRRPTGPGQVLTDVPAGRVYVGGVLVTDRKKLTLSYDLSLAEAKALQNRDRTIVEEWTLRRLIQSILAECTDLDVVERLARAALDGNLPDSERYFNAVRGYGPKLAFEAVGKRIFGDDRVFYVPATRAASQYDNTADEVALDLADRGYTKLEPQIDAWHFAQLMELLGVPKSTTLAVRTRAKNTDVDWVRDTALTADERATLARGVQIVRALYGPDSLAKVRVFSACRLQNEPDLEWGGFYTPRTGDVAVHRSTLADLDRLLAVLIHESAHRLAHRPDGRAGHREFADRTRGFEAQLHTMAARAARALADGVRLEDLAAAHTDMPTDPGVRLGNNTVPTPVPALALAALVEDRLAAWLAEHGQRSPAAFCRATRVAPRHLSALRRGDRLVDFDDAAFVATRLGLTPGVVWWATTGPFGPFLYKSARSRNRKFAGAVHTSALAALADLEQHGEAFAALVPALTDLAEGRTAITDDQQWQEPLSALVAAEAARLRAGTA